MASYNFSALSDGQAISFNPSADVLNFDQSSISAADLRVSTAGSNLVVTHPATGKDVTLLNVSPLQLATSNVTFANGSRLLFGDNTVGTAADNNANSVTGTAGNDLLQGFGGADSIQAGDGNDRIDAGAGNDTISGNAGVDWVEGGLGNDQLSGGGGQDSFVLGAIGASNADVLFDFATDWDNVQLDAAVFASIGASGRFAAGDERFHVGASAAEADDRIIFNSTTRQVFYDADGSGSGAAQLIASLPSGRSVVASDFWVFGNPPPSGGPTSGNDSLVGTPGNDTIDGLGGNDTIDGLGGNDLLIGGSGNDIIYSLSGFDTVDGGAGMDTQVMQGGIAGAGIETIILRGYSVEGGADGHGNELNNTIIDEGPGNAWLYGNGGNDTLIGGSGLNLFVFQGNPSGSSDAYGQDSVDGGGGNDWLFFESNSAAVTVDFRNGTVSGGSTVAAGVVFVNVERAIGSLHNDVMFAGSSGNWLWGYGGADTLVGGAGNDDITGDIGFGHPELEPGDDSISGGGGNDTISGDRGHDWIDGGAGNDLIGGGEDSDTLIGGEGNDTLNAGPGNDDFVFHVAPGNANADLVQSFDSGLNRIVLDGNAMASLGATGQFSSGDARFWAATGANTAHDANDRVVYNTSTGQLWHDADGAGGAGPQLIATLEGAPSVVASDVWVVSGSGAGGATAGNDSLVGTGGNDTLDGLGGNDTIDGLGGDDSLIGGDGADRILGGAGADEIRPDLQEDPFDPLPEFDDYVDAGPGNDLIWGDGGDDTLLGGDGDDAFIMDSGSPNFSSDLRGSDSIDGGAGNDFISFGTESVSSTWSISIDLGAGTYSIAGPTGTVNGVVLNVENVQGTGSSDRIIGTDAANTLRGVVGHDTIDGLGGDDLIQMESGNNVLRGGAGNDTIDGGSASDTISGGLGNDTLRGDWTAFNDDLDSFLFDVAPGAANADTIRGFETGLGKIVLDGNAHAAIGASGDFAAGDGRFWAAAGANTGHDANDRVVYNTSTGQLWYDGDGSGAGAAQLMATLEGAPGLVSTDIAVVNGSGGGTPPIQGTSGNDSIVGTAGNDTIDGLGGNDTMDGLSGDDVFLMSGTYGADRTYGRDGVDTVNFAGAAGAVNASIVGSFASGGGGSVGLFTIENLVGSAFNDTLIGDANANRLEGGAGNDTITGREGNDVLLGNDGDDVFIFNSGGNNYGNDAIDGGAGVDRAEFGSLGRTAAVIDLAAGTVSGGGTAGLGSATVAGIENVIGTLYADRITGNGSANDLAGSNGNDTLAGGAGADTLSGGSGSDFFDFTTAPAAGNADRILDFVSGTDDLRFDDAAHAAIGAAGAFVANDARFWAAAGATSGHDASDRLVYNTSTGSLYYDADGNGAGASVLVATFQGNPALAATDITVI